MIKITKPGNVKRTKYKAECAKCGCEFTLEDGDRKSSILETIDRFLIQVDCPECGSDCYAKVIL